MRINKKPTTLLIAIFISLFLTGCFYKKAKTSSSKRPNIVFILVDDLGWSDLGFMGNPVYETPNLDKLSKESVVFTNAYAAAANCAPSRACIISGQNTPRHGIYTVGSSERGKPHTRKLVPTKNTRVLKEDFFTLAEALKVNKYTTATMGKWHLSDNPKTQGFDVNIAGSTAGHPKSYFSPYKNKALEDGPKDEYLTDRITNEAINFISKNKENPFFLYLPYFTVHTPLQGKKDLVEKYTTKVNGDVRFNARYGAMVENMDTNVGRILDKLKELNIDENTLVVFTSDNGGLAFVSSQFPLRAGKGSYYEGGIRVPFLVKWPLKIKEPKTTDIPVTGLDIYPTLLDVVKQKQNTNLDGVSLLPYLTDNKKIEERSLFWHFPIYLQAVNPKKEQARDPLFRTRPGSVVRKGKWKLHEYFEDNALELYNLEIDIQEKNDVSSQNPEIVKELYQELKAWRNNTNAPVPTKLNQEYNPNK